MRYLLDTNVCIEILRGRNSTLKANLGTKNVNDLVLCSIVWAELQCGARLAQDPMRELARLQDAFGNWQRLPFDDSAAESYGEIRSYLQRAGNLIGANDLFIAAIAQANELMVVTHNINEFTRVQKLPVEDWQG